jgi:hypothetical protein
MYDNQIGRWGVIDPMTERYISTTPYVYANNNPVLFIDPNGMTIRDPNNIFEEYENSLKTRIDNFQKILKDPEKRKILENANVLGSIEETVKGIEDIQKGIAEMRVSDVIYEASYDKGMASGTGLTTVDPNTGVIQLKFGEGSSGQEVIGHEIAHGIRYERGQTSIKADGTAGSIHDITDETNAYKSARLSKYNAVENGIVNDKWTREQLPGYKLTPDGPININSKAGKSMREQTVNEAHSLLSNSEYYKGWEKDYYPALILGFILKGITL